MPLKGHWPACGRILSLEVPLSHLKEVHDGHDLVHEAAQLSVLSKTSEPLQISSAGWSSCHHLLGGALCSRNRLKEDSFLGSQFCLKLGPPLRTPRPSTKSPSSWLQHWIRRLGCNLRAPGLDRATVFRSSASYWNCIGSLEGSSSISQAFPSELEAKIYLELAGETEIDIVA